MRANHGIGGNDFTNRTNGYRPIFARAVTNVRARTRYRGEGGKGVRLMVAEKPCGHRTNDLLSCTAFWIGETI